MNNYFDFKAYPLALVLEKLLEDKTTKKNIIWATNSYKEYGDKYCDRYEMTQGALLGLNPILIQPRAFKSQEDQQERTKKKAEVFTPTWIVNKMVNQIDEEWFGKTDVFNIEEETAWKATETSIYFGKKNWKKYIGQTVLEVTCGEAPFIVSRYNAADGEPIPVKDRVGVLDRKLRIINENSKTEEEWLNWVTKAFKRVYGYEYQGDNLLIGRINLLMTFVEYYEDRWNKQPTKKQLSDIANIIAWNFWQMDGLQGSVPLGVPEAETQQLTLFSFDDEPEEEKAPLCKIYDWKSKNKSVLYNSIKKEGNNMGRHFDVVIGNPPYQDDNDKNNRKPPVYNLFMEAANKVGNVVEFITPARFLFNAGQTPKEWNKKMLNDPHFTVLDYEKDGSSIFPTTDIKGGVAITLRDNNRDFGAIEHFIPNKALRDISNKVRNTSDFIGLNTIVSNRGLYRFSPKLFSDFPDALSKVGAGTKNMIVGNIFEKNPSLFKDNFSNHEISLIGRAGNRRVTKYIDGDYVLENPFLSSWNVIVPKANGSGSFGETLSTPTVVGPSTGTTDTFISIGTLSSRVEAESLLKYIKSKFLRALLGSLKITQDNPKNVWSNIPVQDFTSNSDIDWSKSINEIDQQLYKKFNLLPSEIDFIEANVREME